MPASVRKRNDAKQRKRTKTFVRTREVNSPLIISCKRKELNHYRGKVESKQKNVLKLEMADSCYLAIAMVAY